VRSRTAAVTLSDPAMFGAQNQYGDRSTVLHAERQTIEQKMLDDGRL
jgi:hypothetical protein